jgi:hypothetical protein
MTTDKKLEKVPESKRVPRVDESDPWVRACRALEAGDTDAVGGMLDRQNERTLLVEGAKMRARGKAPLYMVDDCAPFTFDDFLVANADWPLDDESSERIRALELGASLMLNLGAHGVFTFRRVR